MKKILLIAITVLAVQSMMSDGVTAVRNLSGYDLYVRFDRCTDFFGKCGIPVHTEGTVKANKDETFDLLDVAGTMVRQSISVISGDLSWSKKIEFSQPQFAAYVRGNLVVEVKLKKLASGKAAWELWLNGQLTDKGQ